MQVLAPNLAESFAFDLDLDLDLSSFTEASSSFPSDVSLDTIFSNVTDLLDTVANYGPMLNAANTPSAIDGLLDGKISVL